MGELVGGDFNWDHTDKKYGESAKYEATVIHGNFVPDIDDPETYKENVVVFSNLPNHEWKDRTEQIQDLVTEVMDDSIFIEVVDISLHRETAKQKFFKRVLTIVGSNTEESIALSNGATAIIKDTNQKVS